MTRFDWHYFRLALFNLMLTTVGVAVVYVTIDVVVNLDRFREHGSSAADVFDAYLLSMPSILYLLGPLIILLAGNFCVMRSLRSREHLVLQACGLRGSRTIRSFWLVALLAAAFLLGVRLWVLPGLEERETESVLGNLRKASGSQTSLWDVEGNHWSMGSYRLLEQPPVIRDVRIVRYNPTGVDDLIHADQLAHIDGQWRGDVQITSTADPSRPTGASVIREVKDFVVGGTTLTPAAVTRRGERRNFSTLESLREAIAGQPHRRDLQLNLYRLWSWPLMAFVLMLGGASVCLMVRVRNAFLAAGLTLALAFLTLAVTLSLEKLALNGTVAPEFATYLAPAAVFLLATAALRWKVD